MIGNRSWLDQRAVNPCNFFAIAAPYVVQACMMEHEMLEKLSAWTAGYYLSMHETRLAGQLLMP
eukprot:323317-Pelagomonas_calceolata.AAC.2